MRIIEIPDAHTGAELPISDFGGQSGSRQRAAPPSNCDCAFSLSISSRQIRSPKGNEVGRGHLGNKNSSPDPHSSIHPFIHPSLCLSLSIYPSVCLSINQFAISDDQPWYTEVCSRFAALPACWLDAPRLA
eukprot:GHVU01096474.1.p1 GENE.GHVU01096474.1~~GHVU01096474.1.p1  ORF type:complete len:131 (+),score=2.26 GHVU01096474.1:486-878(+)